MILFRTLIHSFRVVYMLERYAFLMEMKLKNLAPN